MSLLIELNSLISSLNIAVETGIFSGNAPNEYVVITPLAESYEVFADNRPEYETQEARLSLFTKTSYIQRKNQITTALLNADMTITARRYMGLEVDSRYHHYSIDVMKEYKV